MMLTIGLVAQRHCCVDDVLAVATHNAKTACELYCKSILMMLFTVRIVLQHLWVDLTRAHILDAERQTLTITHNVRLAECLHITKL